MGEQADYELDRLFDRRYDDGWYDDGWYDDRQSAMLPGARFDRELGYYTQTPARIADPAALFQDLTRGPLDDWLEYERFAK